jgi:hypothetical protein
MAANATASGPAPFNVTVTLGAKGLPAGKAFTWTLDFGDGKSGAAANASGSASHAPSSSGTGSGSASSSGSPSGSASGSATGSSGSHSNATKPGTETGSKLPATAKHSYAAPGNFTLRFTLAPAGAASAELHTKVQATAPPPANATGNATSGQPLAPETFHAEGDILLGGTEVDCDQVGSVDETWTIPAEKDGSAVSVKHLNIHLTGDTTSVDLDITVHTPDGATLGNTDGDAGDSDETVDADGPYPPGDYAIHISACAAVMGGYTLDGTADLVTA